MHSRIASIVRRSDDVYALNDKLSHGEVKAAYNSLDFLIGTRFHSVIFALTSNVPAIAIEYEHKTGGIMHDLDLDEWVIKMHDVNPAWLKKSVDKLVRNSKTYKTHLKSILPAYIRETKQPIHIVEDSYIAVSSKNLL